jgi:hypothetical protein
MGHIEKVSFHESGICRRAFTREHGAPSTMTDWVMNRWRGQINRYTATTKLRPTSKAISSETPAKVGLPRVVTCKMMAVLGGNSSESI